MTLSGADAHKYKVMQPSFRTTEVPNPNPVIEQPVETPTTPPETLKPPAENNQPESPAEEPVNTPPANNNNTPPPTNNNTQTPPVNNNPTPPPVNDPTPPVQPTPPGNETPVNNPPPAPVPEPTPAPVLIPSPVPQVVNTLLGVYSITIPENATSEEFNVILMSYTDELFAKYSPLAVGKSLSVLNKGRNSAGQDLVRIEVWAQEVI